MLKDFKRKVACAMVAVMLTTVLPSVMGYEGTIVAAKAATKKTVTISSIADVEKTVKVDDQVTMPKTVTAVMSDKTKKKVAVRWNKVLNSDMDGTYTASGTVSGYSKKVTYTLKVTAPKMGTIRIPEVTDNTLAKPTDITLEVGKSRVGEDGPSKEVDDTLLSVFWTPASSEADEYKICIYDQYKRIVTEYGLCINAEELTNSRMGAKLNLFKVKNLIISAITITPVKSTEEGRMTGDSSKNGTGETAVFECAVKVTVNTGKTVVMKDTKLENNDTAYGLSFSEKIAPYTYFELYSEYQFIGSDTYGTSARGQFSGEDGSILFICLNNELEKNIYMGASSKLSLRVYSDAVMDGKDKGAYTVTIYPVEYKSAK